MQTGYFRYSAGALLLLLPLLPAHADFEAGMKAYAQGDFEAALREWQPLADQGMVEAQFNLGLIRHHGQGVPQDLAEAHRWYLLAADAGYARAQYQVAEMYESGEGVGQDLVQAHFWFRLAAAQDHADAKKRKKRVAKKMTPKQIAYSDLMLRQRKQEERDQN